MPGSSYRAIYEIAEEQNGCVTTAQAAEVGVSQNALVQMARRGVLERVSRGVYRLSRFPSSPLDQHVEASLWPLSVTRTVNPPSSERTLARYVAAHARETGADVARVRRLISFMAMAGALRQAVRVGGAGPRFVVNPQKKLHITQRNREAEQQRISSVSLPLCFSACKVFCRIWYQAA